MNYASEKQIRQWIADAQNNCTIAKEYLVRNFHPLVISLVNKYRHSSPEKEELIQIGMLGLLKAIQRFDLTVSNRFIGYAIPTILGELRRYFRDETWDVHVPRRVKELYNHVNRALHELYILYERSPTIQEISDHLQVDEEAVLETLELMSGYKALSLETPVETNSNGSTSAAIYELHGEIDAHFEKIEEAITANQIFSVLTPLEKIVIHSLYIEECTQTQVAAKLGISQMQVSRTRRRALQKLKNAVYTEETK